MTRYSTGQARAIESRGKNLLVSAAAGSGKTFTLVERVVRQLIEGAFHIDELVIVTFTNAAASEMRERIEKKLTESLKDFPIMAHELTLLPNASISTLHSFCQRLIRENFSVLGLDPKFRLAGEHEMDLIRRRVIEDLFEKKYESGDEDFLAFAESFGSDRDDSPLYSMVLTLSDFAMSQPEPMVWLDSVARSFDIPEGAALSSLPWYDEVIASIGRALDGCRETARYLGEEAGRVGLLAYADVFMSDDALIGRLMKAWGSGDWEVIGEAFSGELKFAALRAPRGEDIDEYTKKFFSDARDREIKSVIRSIREKYFSTDEAGLIDDLRAAYREALTISHLAADFLASLAAAKRKKAVLDFGDLEHLTLKLLMDEDVARGIRARYREIMVDEYQDTNGVQEAILSRLTNGKNLFAVGDVKQSIYRFRLADPTLFMGKYAAYAKDGVESENIGLGENYRSRPTILAAVNFIFSQLMTRSAVEIDYDEEAALYGAADYPKTDARSFADSPVELILIEGARPGADGEELKGFAAEAKVVARRLLELHESGVNVYDKDEKKYRPIRWRDMAVLLRSAKGKAEVMTEALRERDIPSYAALDTGYFAENEIRLMLSLLSVIDNSRQDIPLAAVLRSPVVNMTDEELATLRADHPAEDLYSSLAHSKNEKAVRFMVRLSSWRDLSRRVGVPELLWHLYRDTGYYDYVGAEPGGLVRQANLRMLKDRAADYEKTDFRGLFRFLQFIRRMKGRDTDLSSARTLGENEDVVRVMTVHRSKGLEFPVVIIADIGKSFNMQDARSTLLIHRELGLGSYVTKSDGLISWRYPTFARMATASRIEREAKAEEMRVLYVAMTRAREKLIMTGSIDRLEKSAAKWSRPAKRRELPLPDHTILSAPSWLDWIAAAISRDGAGGSDIRGAAGIDSAVHTSYDAALMGTPSFQVTVTDAGEILPPEREEAASDEWLQRVRELLPLPLEEDDELLASLSWRYEWRGDIPAKMTVSEIKRRMMEPAEPPASEIVPPTDGHDDFSASDEWELYEESSMPEPREGRRRHGMAFGTLMHEAIQRLDLSRPLDEADISRQLAELSQKGYMTKEERKAVSIKSIAHFFASPLGFRMRRARRVWREQQFSMLIPAREIVPDTSGDDEIFLQGVIDVFFEEADGRLVLLDYKTDRRTTPEAIRERYRIQLALYARAILAVTGRRVDESYIYRLSEGDVIDMRRDF